MRKEKVDLRSLKLTIEVVYNLMLQAANTLLAFDNIGYS